MFISDYHLFKLIIRFISTPALGVSTSYLAVMFLIISIKSRLKRLTNANTRKDLADILGFQPSVLTYIVYKIPIKDKYTIFDIPKKNGEIRTIKAPKFRLKKLQKSLANLFYDCLLVIEAGNKPLSFGFKKGLSIIGNAKNHRNRRYILNIDLSDFFQSFNFGRVRGFFLKDKNFQLQEVIATTIAQIACDEIGLPQGSPCSPVISELIGRILDIRLVRLAKDYGLRYSRYADDITFSTNNKVFPNDICKQDSINAGKWILGEKLKKEIDNAGFVINFDKVRMHYRTSRQLVTGLVVNKKVNVKREYYKNSRAMCNSLFCEGKYYIDQNFFESSKNDLTRLEGILNYIYTIRQEKTAVKKDHPPTTEHHHSANKQLYQAFLYYKHFVALTSPLIITEGKTDVIYLREALKSLYKDYPQLVKVSKSNKNNFNFLIDFFNYSNQTAEIMSINGGSDYLKKVILYCKNNKYSNKDQFKAFKFNLAAYPVILLLDNDEGLNEVAATIKDVYKKKNKKLEISVNSTSDFYHIFDNLYLIKTPEPPTQDTPQSCIEDMFSKKLLEIEIGGKKFDKTSKQDTKTHYGKAVFAQQIVKKNANKIDFSGFDPIFNRIISVLNDYKKIHNKTYELFYLLIMTSLI